MVIATILPHKAVFLFGIPVRLASSSLKSKIERKIDRHASHIRPRKNPKARCYSDHAKAKADVPGITRQSLGAARSTEAMPPPNLSPKNQLPNPQRLKRRHGKNKRPKRKNAKGDGGKEQSDWVQTKTSCSKRLE